MNEESPEFQKILKYQLNITTIIKNMDSNYDFFSKYRFKIKPEQKIKKQNVIKKEPGIIKKRFEDIEKMLKQRIPIRRIAKNINCNYSQLYKLLKKKNLIPDSFKRKKKETKNIDKIKNSLSFDSE